MKLPVSLMNSLANAEGFDKEAFEAIHQSGEQVTSIRINPLKCSVEELSRDSSLSNGLTGHRTLPVDTFAGRVPWSEFGYYLAERPSFTFDPLFHAGCYYVQEASSMFLEQALKQTLDLSQKMRILDLAAAPGGKSTHIQSLISRDSLLVSNEVIKSRANVLKDNVIKWGCDNVIITNSDPKDFAKLENFFDVIIVDAPCSGSGLFRRDHEAVEEWSLNNVQLCSQRQQRILADVWPALRKDGILIYSTCSYSQQENEEVVQWLINNFTMENCQWTIAGNWGIVETENGYRFWPDKVKGEGFFISCLKKKDGQEHFDYIIRNRLELPANKEIEIAKGWLKKTNHRFIKHRHEVHAISENLLKDLNILLTHLRVIYFGVNSGQVMRDKLVPAHALAMSNLYADHIERVEFTYSDAVAYLKKQELKNFRIENKGWKLAAYQSHPLGWMNVLPGRINNYYPKELRILKDI